MDGGRSPFSASLMLMKELAQRGQALYDSGIRQQVEAGNEGNFVAIDLGFTGFWHLVGWKVGLVGAIVTKRSMIFF